MDASRQGLLRATARPLVVLITTGAIGGLGVTILPRPSDSTPVKVASGSEDNGFDWLLTASWTDVGLCVSLVSSTAGSSGGACGFGIRGEEPTGVNLLGYLSETVYEPKFTFVYGPLADGADKVAIKLENGGIVYASLFDGATRGFPTDFYAWGSPGLKQVMWIEALDRRPGFTLGEKYDFSTPMRPKIIRTTYQDL